MDTKIDTLKSELLEKYNIKSDTDLIAQLQINEENTYKLFDWIKYQCAYSYREGYNNAIEDSQLKQILELSTFENLQNADDMQNALESIYDLVFAELKKNMIM
jgi:hypothetical protein